MAFLADPTCLTAALLQLEELGRFRTQQKGKGREGDVNDLDISVDCLEHELVGLIQVFYDREDCRLVFAQPSTAEQASLKQFYAQQPAETIAGPAKQSSPPQLPRTPTPPPIVVVSSSAVAKTLYANASTQTAPRTAVRDASTQFQLDSNITTNGSAMLEDEAPGKTPSGEDKASNATASAVDDLSAERNLAMIKVLKCLVSLKLQDQVKSVIEIDQVMTTAECVACGDRYVEKLVFSAPCAHKYCPECLVSLFQASTTDESLFPPRCCREVIPLEGAVCEQLPTKLILELERKQVEFSTTDRTYCCGGSCGKFIPPREIVSQRGYCCACQLLTCTICKGAIHEGLCPDDPAKKELLAAARNNGWQQCYGCQNLVELAIGCNHISKCNGVSEDDLDPRWTDSLNSLPLRKSVLLRMWRTMEDLCLCSVGCCSAYPSGRTACWQRSVWRTRQRKRSGTGGSSHNPKPPMSSCGLGHYFWYICL